MSLLGLASSCSSSVSRQVSTAFDWRVMLLASLVACNGTLGVGEPLPEKTPPVGAEAPAPDRDQKLPAANPSGVGAVAGSDDPVVQVAAGSVNTCARHSSGAVSCWGYGFGLTPVLVPQLKGATHLAGGNAGSFLECAVMGDGSVRCLGATSSWTETRVEQIHDELGPITDAVRLTVGEGAACVLRASGKVSCMSSWQGSASRLVWPTVPAFQGAVDVHAGRGRICAVRGDDVTCMGESRYAQGVCADQVTCACTGDPSCSSEHGPFRVLSRSAMLAPTPASFVSVRTDRDYTMVLDALGNVFVWGQNPTAMGPNQIRVEDAQLQRKYVAAMDFGTGSSACDVLLRPSPYDGVVSCWGESPDGAAVPMPHWTATHVVTDAQTKQALKGIVGISVGLAHTCAWNARGEAYCWGRNPSGQVGDGTDGTVRIQAALVKFPARPDAVVP